MNVVHYLSDRSLQNKLSEVNRYFNENKLQEVDGILFQLEKEYPNHPEVLNNIGLLHLKHNNNEESGKYFHKAVELDPNNLTYRHNFEMIQPNKSYYRNDSDFNRNTQTEYAGFWIRFFAFLIDYFIIFGLLEFASFIISGFQSFTTSDGEFFLYQLLRYPIFIVIPWLYYSLMESSSKQATLGKILLHIKVTDLHRQKISFGR
jgi:tetratricopeptide (TPR) repeat protein